MIAWYRTIWCQCHSRNVIEYFHRDHNASCLILPPHHKKMHTLCFQFLLGITDVPRGIEDNAYANFWKLTRSIMVSFKMVNSCVCVQCSLHVMHWVIHFARFKDNFLTPYEGKWLRIFFKHVREKMNDLKAKWKTWNWRLTSQWPFGRKSVG